MIYLIYGLDYEATEEFRGDSDRRLYRTLVEVPFTFRGINYVIPVGFLTDFVSAPAWARKLLPMKDMQHAALIHDYLCNLTLLSKPACNRCFRDVMKADDVPFFWRWSAWAYVSRPLSPRVRWRQPYIEGATA